MRRFLLFIPVVLFVLLNACVPGPEQINLWIQQTMTATAWTPTSTANPPTTYINSAAIVSLLNTKVPEDDLLKRADELEHTIGARYDVVDVKYEVRENGFAVLLVVVHCQCAAKPDCCSPERLFVLIMRNMEVYREQIMQYITVPVNEMQVSCLDHGKEQGIIMASWADVKDYLYGQIGGAQFGSRVWSK